MRCVVIESPYAGKDDIEVERNLMYLRACLRDSLMRGEAPYASHGLYTQPGVLDDNVPEERRLGMHAGKWIGQHMDWTVVYDDFGISPGMEDALNYKKNGYQYETRQIDPDVVEDIKRWEQNKRGSKKAHEEYDAAIDRFWIGYSKKMMESEDSEKQSRYRRRFRLARERNAPRSVFVGNKEISDLTDEDRKEIHEFAMKRSREMMGGDDD